MHSNEKCNYHFPPNSPKDVIGIFIIQYYLNIMPTLGLCHFFGIMAGWHYGEGSDLGLCMTAN